MIPTSTQEVLLISSYIDNDFAINFKISFWLIFLLILFFLIIIFWKIYNGSSHGPNFEIDKTEVGLGSGKIIFKPNLEDQQIAYQIWVELSTRKIGLPIDLKHDVIVDIYNSWYDFFSVTRNLVKDIPVSKVKKKSTQEIINFSISLLNDGLRPHLTCWQNRFRHWYKYQLKKEEGDIDPQILQEKYPKFQELKEDMLIVNQRLIKYREKMYELIIAPVK